MAESYEFSEIGETADAVREHIIVHQAELPDHVRDRLKNLTTTGVSPVDLVVGFVNAVYANRSEFDTDGKRLAAAGAELVQMKGFHNAMDGRAGGISNALRRETGLKAPAGRTWPSRDEDPEAAAAWAPPPEPTEDELSQPGAVPAEADAG